MTPIRKAMWRSVEPAFVVLLDGRTITIRPKRVRRPEAQVLVSWSQVYQWALLRQAPPKRKVKRGGRL